MSEEMNKVLETEETAGKIDISKYPEGPMEVVKHMGYLAENDEERMKILMAYVMNCMAM